MSTSALVVIGISVLLIILILMFSRDGRNRRVNLTALSNEARDRYLT